MRLVSFHTGQTGNPVYKYKTSSTHTTAVSPEIKETLDIFTRIKGQINADEVNNLLVATVRDFVQMNFGTNIQNMTEKLTELQTANHQLTKAEKDHIQEVMDWVTSILTSPHALVLPADSERKTFLKEYNLTQQRRFNREERQELRQDKSTVWAGFPTDAMIELYKACRSIYPLSHNE